MDGAADHHHVKQDYELLREVNDVAGYMSMAAP